MHQRLDDHRVCVVVESDDYCVSVYDESQPDGELLCCAYDFSSPRALLCNKHAFIFAGCVLEGTGHPLNNDTARYV